MMDTSIFNKKIVASDLKILSIFKETRYVDKNRQKIVVLEIDLHKKLLPLAVTSELVLFLQKHGIKDKIVTDIRVGFHEAYANIFSHSKDGKGSIKIKMTDNIFLEFLLRNKGSIGEKNIKDFVKRESKALAKLINNKVTLHPHTGMYFINKTLEMVRISQEDDNVELTSNKSLLYIDPEGTTKFIVPKNNVKKSTFFYSLLACVTSLLKHKKRSADFITEVFLSLNEAYENMYFHSKSKGHVSVTINKKYIEFHIRNKYTKEDRDKILDPNKKEKCDKKLNTPDYFLRNKTRNASMGILLMKKYMDEVEHEFTSDDYTLIIRKYFRKPRTKRSASHPQS